MANSVGRSQRSRSLVSSLPVVVLAQRQERELPAVVSPVALDPLEHADAADQGLGPDMDGRLVPRGEAPPHVHERRLLKHYHDELLLVSGTAVR